MTGRPAQTLPIWADVVAEQQRRRIIRARIANRLEKDTGFAVALLRHRQQGWRATHASELVSLAEKKRHQPRQEWTMRNGKKSRRKDSCIYALEHEPGQRFPPRISDGKAFSGSVPAFARQHDAFRKSRNRRRIDRRARSREATAAKDGR